jgi:hypothetical protein
MKFGLYLLMRLLYRPHKLEFKSDAVESVFFNQNCHDSLFGPSSRGTPFPMQCSYFSFNVNGNWPVVA